ncbi:MAG: NUDIX hydrolase [Spirochaetia bacterium]|jgi:ADP-ribose pyrophosphatase|nr:NUDIX hydrolase [Spirochaetia bacterium]
MKDIKKLLWTENTRKILNNCRIFDLYQVEKRSPLGEVGSFFLLDAPDWITVIPLITDKNGINCFLMVEQYRHGSDEITLEFPAGMIDEGELPLNAAKRELLEETGYASGDLIEIGSVSPNPAFMNNIIYTYIAKDLVSTGKQNLDSDEFIHFHLIPCIEVIEKMGTGRYSNGVMMMALAYYQRWLGAGF